MIQIGYWSVVDERLVEPAWAAAERVEAKRATLGRIYIVLPHELALPRALHDFAGVQDVRVTASPFAVSRSIALTATAAHVDSNLGTSAAVDVIVMNKKRHW